jgi:hypothetical protein
MESAWTIEDASFDRNSPKFWGGRYGWTSDPMKAVRFSREEDAISQAQTMERMVTSGLRISYMQWGA